jgi:hypothetical protein
MPLVGPPEVAPAIKPSRRPGCGKTIRLESSAPNTHYANLDQLRFVCDCGQTSRCRGVPTPKSPPMCEAGASIIGAAAANISVLSKRPTGRELWVWPSSSLT